ncbi:MAG: Hpt domain-containing protein [Pseudorhodobacter sp.]|nr:MAG: Hpt domain-containing protein [Pseudorhodobacter sp.]
MIDWSRVTELRDEIGSEDFAEVVALFLEEADEVVARLPACDGARPLESALHFLKGSALNLGFDQLAALCQDGERQAGAGSVSVGTAAIAACYAASKSEFERGLDRLGDTGAA